MPEEPVAVGQIILYQVCSQVRAQPPFGRRVIFTTGTILVMHYVYNVIGPHEIVWQLCIYEFPACLVAKSS